MTILNFILNRFPFDRWSWLKVHNPSPLFIRKPLCHNGHNHLQRGVREWVQVSFIIVDSLAFVVLWNLASVVSVLRWMKLTNQDLCRMLLPTRSRYNCFRCSWGSQQGHQLPSLWVCTHIAGMCICSVSPLDSLLAPWLYQGRCGSRWSSAVIRCHSAFFVCMPESWRWWLRWGLGIAFPVPALTLQFVECHMHGNGGEPRTERVVAPIG